MPNAFYIAQTKRNSTAKQTQFATATDLQQQFVEERRARCILQRAVVGRQLLDEQRAAQLVYTRAERLAAEYSDAKKQQLHHEQLISEVPAEFDRATDSWTAHYEIDESGQFCIRNKGYPDNPDFAPSGAALIAKRRQQLFKLRRAANIIIKGIRAKKMLTRLREALGTSGIGEQADDLYSGFIEGVEYRHLEPLSKNTASTTSIRSYQQRGVHAAVKDVVLGKCDDLSIYKMTALEQLVDEQAIEQKLNIKIAHAEDFVSLVFDPPVNDSVDNDEKVRSVPSQVLCDSLFIYCFSCLSEAKVPDFESEFY